MRVEPLFPAKSGSNRIVLQHRGLDAKAGPAEQKFVDIGLVGAIEKGPIVRLNLPRDPQHVRLVRGLNEETVVPAGATGTAVAADGLPSAFPVSLFSSACFIAFPLRYPRFKTGLFVNRRSRERLHLRLFGPVRRGSSLAQAARIHSAVQGRSLVLSRIPALPAGAIAVCPEHDIPLIDSDAANVPSSPQIQLRAVARFAGLVIAER